MSHFTVLVIGEDPDEQLAKYDENLTVEMYVYEDLSKKEKEDFFKEFIKKSPEDNPNFKTVVSDNDPYGEEDWGDDVIFPYSEEIFEELYKKFGEKWNDNFWKKDDDGIWRSYTSYNPDSKWDWYQLGGRWQGFFKIKEGGNGKLGNPGAFGKTSDCEGKADCILKKDIDFEGMEKETAKKAEKRYDKAMEDFGYLEPCKTWSEILDIPDLSLDEKRNLYYGQPRCAEARKKGYHFGVDEFSIPKEKYIEKRVESCYIPFALVYNGEWMEKGSMGMFGYSDDKKTEKEWNEQVKNIISSLPDDTLFSLFDCHI